MDNIKEYVARKKEELRNYISEHNYNIHTIVCQVGEVPASTKYVAGKLKDAAEIGIDAVKVSLPEETTEMDLLELIDFWNKSEDIDGFIIQLPLPKHISEERITKAINPNKDIDGFTKEALVDPATPAGIIQYLEDNNFKFEDANAIVCGRSNIVGRPIARMLLDRNCNVSVIHSKTSWLNKVSLLKKADLVIVATGHRHTVTDFDMCGNKKAFIVDVGINVNEDGKLCGDCEDITICEKTPVPGGAGLLTRFALMNNIVKVYEANHEK